MARVRTAVVAAALVAALAPATFGGSAAFAASPAATAAGPTAAEVGTVVQEGGRLTVPAGEEGPVTLRFTATLPAGVKGPVTASFQLDTWLTEDEPGSSPVSQDVIRSVCAVNGVSYGECAWNMPYFPPVLHDPPTRPSLDLPAVPAAETLTYTVTLDADRTATVLGHPNALVALMDSTGATVAQGTLGLDFVPGTPPPGQRGAVHARDKDGVLWRYEGTGDVSRPFATRKRVGGGWNAYTAVAPLTSATADGRGGLVARDQAGVLWYYAGTGKPSAPFAPRQRVGGGWNTYTALVGVGDGSLVARDRDGVMWRYKAEHNTLYGPRQRVGGGWNTYTALTMSGAHDGALGRDKDGVLWKYNRYGPYPSPPFQQRQRVGGGWNTYTAIAGTAELGRDDRPDLVARDRDGKLWLYQGAYKPLSGLVPGSSRSLVGGGWNTYDLIF
ncbi:tachylectin-related carbohydrate-binding protein [Streptomyces exfoliatus]|uniref:tachylectin-related carbohydrate-binding protein n=1 Tax=Streptomyces exfoliatus TaxID=1905 RepID=UPI000B0E1903|nr:tachylectin-related carbohydrate-binding protein [Streptomyces exfoliatus]